MGNLVHATTKIWFPAPIEVWVGSNPQTQIDAYYRDNMFPSPLKAWVVSYG